MSKLGFAVAAALSLLTVSAVAADLPSRKAHTPVAVTPDAAWTGFYAGLHVGNSWGHSSQRDLALAVPGGSGGSGGAGGSGGSGGSGGVGGDGDYNVNGGVIGGTIGYNWQAQSFVYGLEGDAAWANISGSSTACGTTAHTCGTKSDAFATARVRGGVAFDNTLLYATGGAAFAQIKAYDNGWTGVVGKSGSAFQTTWTVGAGIEHKIDARWSVKAEYLYAAFGRKAYFQLVGFTPEQVNLNLNVVRVGVNYKF